MPCTCTYVKVLNMLKKLKKDIDRDLQLLLKDIRNDISLNTSSRILYKCIKDFTERDGKRIRPILFLLSYLGYTRKKRAPYKKLLRCSLSLELLHDFLLIHDDVIDKSDLRRGKPTLHRLFNSELGLPSTDDLGADLSIVAGDILFAVAMNTLLSFDEISSRKERALSLFTRTAMSTGIGEFIDVINNKTEIENIKQKDISLMYTLKTSKYTFSGPLLMGAILAGAPEKELKKLSGLGILLGEGFQIYDDLLDVFSTSKKTGKPVLSDLNESKKTLLLWKTHQTAQNNDRKTIRYILKKKQKSRTDLLKLRDLIINSGSGKYCLNKALSLLDESVHTCSTLNLKPDYAVLLNNFIEDLISKTNTLGKNIPDRAKVKLHRLKSAAPVASKFH